MTMLVLSCNQFSDLWDGQIKLLERNWPDREIDTYIVTDAHTDKQYPDIKILNIENGAEWSERLSAALEYVQTDYVFITLDDYYLIKKVNDRQIQDLLDMMEKEKIDYIRLFCRPKRATKQELQGYRKIYKVDNSCDYSVNLYSGIWRREFIKSCIRTPMNAWKFEVSLHKRAEEYGANCVVSLNNEYEILDVVRKGKLLHKAVAYFHRHPGIYEGEREVNTWWYEIKLAFQQMVARHLPWTLHQWVKAFMTKHGRKFYSDEAE